MFTKFDDIVPSKKFSTSTEFDPITTEKSSVVVEQGSIKSINEVKYFTLLRVFPADKDGNYHFRTLRLESDPLSKWTTWWLRNKYGDFNNELIVFKAVEDMTRTQFLEMKLELSDMYQQYKFNEDQLNKKFTEFIAKHFKELKFESEPIENPVG